jgi:hypothetical protein
MIVRRFADDRRLFGHFFVKRSNHLPSTNLQISMEFIEKP